MWMLAAYVHGKNTSTPSPLSTVGLKLHGDLGLPISNVSQRAGLMNQNIYCKLGRHQRSPSGSAGPNRRFEVEPNRITIKYTEEAEDLSMEDSQFQDILRHQTGGDTVEADDRPTRHKIDLEMPNRHHPREHGMHQPPINNPVFSNLFVFEYSQVVIADFAVTCMVGGFAAGIQICSGGPEATTEYEPEYPHLMYRYNRYLHEVGERGRWELFLRWC